jgi:hypothetical protein
MAFEKNDDYKKLSFKQLGEFKAQQTEELKSVFDKHTDSGDGQLRMTEDALKEVREISFLGCAVHIYFRTVLHEHLLNEGLHVFGRCIIEGLLFHLDAIRLLQGDDRALHEGERDRERIFRRDVGGRTENGLGTALLNSFFHDSREECADGFLEEHVFSHAFTDHGGRSLARAEALDVHVFVETRERRLFGFRHFFLRHDGRRANAGIFEFLNLRIHEGEGESR